MKKNVTWLSILALTVALAAPALADDKSAGDSKTVTGFVTDDHCKDKGAVKAHTADCVESCVKGGAKAQIKADDGKVYNIDSAGWAKVKGLMGGKVTVKGTVDEKTNTIKVASAEKAPESN
jgi:hypothetical protein